MSVIVRHPLSEEDKREALVSLVGARKILAPRERWTKGTAYDGYAYCLTGAMRQAAGMEGGYYAAELVAWDVLGQMGEDVVGLEGWNDSPVRRHEDVLALLDRAIALVHSELSTDCEVASE